MAALPTWSMGLFRLWPGGGPAVAVLAALAAATAAAAAPDCRGVSGRVVDAVSEAPLSGVTVSLLAAAEVSDESGQFCFPVVPRERKGVFSLNLRDRYGSVVGCEVFELDLAFAPVAAAVGDLVDVQVVEPSLGAPVILRLAAVQPEQVDRYCVTCHRWNPCLLSPQVVSVTESRKYLRGLIVTEKEVKSLRKELRKKALRKETYRQIRFTDTHALPMDLGRFLQTNPGDRYRRPPDLNLTADGRSTCDTCHTRHLPTGNGAYAVLPYQRGNELCHQCHRR